METTVQRLRYVLQVLEPAVGGKTLPILHNVVVGQGFAYATNLETRVSVKMPEATDDPVLLPHRQLLSLLRHIPAATPLTINREGQAIKLVAGATKAEFPLPGQVKDFPPVPSFQPIGEGQVDGDLFLKTATALAPYAATDTSRPVLQCVCVTLGDPLEMVAGDGFRLAWQTIPIKLTAPDRMASLLLPTTAVDTLARVWKVMEKEPTVDDQESPDPGFAQEMPFSGHFLCKTDSCTKTRLYPQLVNCLDQDADIMTQNLCQNLIDHPYVALAPH